MWILLIYPIFQFINFQRFVTFALWSELFNDAKIMIIYWDDDDEDENDDDNNEGCTFKVKASEKVINNLIFLSGNLISSAYPHLSVLPSGRKRISSEFTFEAEMAMPLYKCSVENLLFCNTTPVDVECE